MLSEKPWTPDAVIKLFLLLFISLLLGGLVIGWLETPAAQQLITDESLATLIIQMFSFQIVGLILVHFFLREHGTSWASGFGLRTPGRGRALMLAVVVAVVVLPVAWWLSLLSAQALTALGWQPEQQSAVQTLQRDISLAHRIGMGMMAIMLAPVLEELLFRGILYPLIKQHGFPLVALWGTALLFAAVHANLMTLLPLTFLALVLTLLYEATDNLLAPILTHSLFNAVNFFWLTLGVAAGD